MSTLNFQIPPPIIGPVIGGKNKTVSHQAICGEGIAFQLVRRENTRGESPTTPTFVLRGASRLMILDLEADLGSYPSFLLTRRVCFGTLSLLSCTL
jgi:hypothetical protein